MPLPILSVKVSVFARATEDVNKVIKALRTVTGGISKEHVQEAKGVLGNKICIIESVTRKRSEARKIWKNIWENLREEDRQLLKERLPDFLDEFGRIHLRFDKQSAYLGKLKLTSGGGVVKAVIQLEAYPANPEKFKEAAKKLIKEGC